MREILASSVLVVLEVGLGNSTVPEPFRLRVNNSVGLSASDLVSPRSESSRSLGDGETDSPMVLRKAAIDSDRSREPQLPEGCRVRPSGKRPGIRSDAEPVLLAAPRLSTLPTRLRPARALDVLRALRSSESGLSALACKPRAPAVSVVPVAKAGAEAADVLWLSWRLIRRVCSASRSASLLACSARSCSSC